MLGSDLVGRVTESYLQTATGSEAARLRFLKGIWDIQADVEATAPPYDAPDADAAREALASGRPLFAVIPPEVPLAAYADTASRIARYTSETAGLPAEQAEALRHADFGAAIDPERLAGAALSPETFIADVARSMRARPEGPLTPATVAFVLVSTLVPFLTGPARSACEVIGESDRGAPATGACPVCGAAASMGRMGESTQAKGAARTLWCGACNTEWGYERLRCVRCGSLNTAGLRYTHVEDDPAHRVQLCDECYGYTRFVFTGDLAVPVSMVVEDAATASIEAVAVQQCYTATGDGGQAGC